MFIYLNILKRFFMIQSLYPLTIMAELYLAVMQADYPMEINCCFYNLLITIYTIFLIFKKIRNLKNVINLSLTLL